MATQEEILTEAVKRGIIQIPIEDIPYVAEASRRGLLDGKPAAPEAEVEQGPPSWIDRWKADPLGLPRFNKHADQEADLKAQARSQALLGNQLGQIQGEVPFEDPVQTLPPTTGGWFDRLPRPRQHEWEQAKLTPQLTTSSEQIARETEEGGLEEPWIQPELVGAAAFGSGAKIALAAGKKFVPAIVQGLASMLPSTAMEFPIGQLADMAAEDENPELALLISVGLGFGSGLTVESLAEKGLVDAVTGAIKRYPRLSKATLPADVMAKFKAEKPPQAPVQGGADTLDLTGPPTVDVNIPLPKQGAPPTADVRIPLKPAGQTVADVNIPLQAPDALPKPSRPAELPAPPAPPPVKPEIPKAEGLGKVEEPEKIVSAVTRIGKNIYEGKTHGESINKAIEAGDIRETPEGLVDRDGDDLYGTGHSDLFKTSKGRIIDRFTASNEFGISAAERIPPAAPAEPVAPPVLSSEKYGVFDEKTPPDQRWTTAHNKTPNAYPHHIPAVKLADGTVYFDKTANIHAQVINNKALNIPADQVVGGGYIIKGKYVEDSFDAAKIGQAAAAAKKTVPPPKPEHLPAVVGAPAGLEEDEEGNLSFDPKKAALAMAGGFLGVHTWGKGKKALYAMAKKTKEVTPRRVHKFIRDTDSVSAHFWKREHELDKDLGLYEAVKGNSDPQYKESVDFSTLCRKRRVMMKAIEDKQVAIGRGLTAGEFLEVRQQLKDAGEVVSCGPCYVDSQRMRLGDVSNLMIERHPELDKNLFLSQEGFDTLKKKHPEVYKELIAETAPRGMKTPESYAEYDHQILQFNKKRVDRINSQPGGLRWFSWSDFEPQHLLDGLQAIGDMAVKGLKGHGYTKVVEFVETFGKTGLKINMSLIPAGDTGLTKAGALDFDPIEGMPAEEAFRLRLKYPENAGTIAIGVSDENINKLLSDPKIDYVIPYHSSGMSMETRKKHGWAWKDYTSVQKEKVTDKAKNAAAGGKHTVDWDEWKGDVAKYKALCDERGLSYKFPQFLKHPNYWKFHVDFKRKSNAGRWLPEQKPVQPIFDTDTLNRIATDKKVWAENPAARVREKSGTKLSAVVGAPAGLEQDEEGNWTVDPRKALIGMFAGAAAGKGKGLGRRMQDAWDRKFGEPVVDFFRRTWDGWIVNEDLRYALGKGRSKDAERLIKDTQREIEVAQAKGIRIAHEIEKLAPTQLEQRRFRQIIKGSVTASKAMAAKAQEVNALFSKLKDLEKEHDLYKYSRFDKATDAVNAMSKKERARIRKLLSGPDPYTQTEKELYARARELGLEPDDIILDAYRGRADLEKQNKVKLQSEKGHDKRVLAEAVAEALAFEKSRLNDYYHYGSAQEYFPLYYSKHEGLTPEQRKKLEKVIWDLKKQSRRGTPEGQADLEEQIAEYEEMLGRGLKGRRKRRFKRMELSLGYSHRRQDLPEDVQKVLGRIDEATFPVAKGVAQQQSDIAKAKLFEAIADHPEWSFKYSPGMDKPANYRLVDGKKFGALDGMYVRRDILDQLQEVEDMRSDFIKGYDYLQGIWKSWHTVWNPSTLSRNVQWNAIAAWLGDVPFSEFAKMPLGKGVYWEAAQALRTADVEYDKLIPGKPNMYYREARDWGLLNNTFYAHELNALRDELERLRDPSKFKNWVRNTLSAPGKMYQGSETFFKMAVFIKARKDGLSVDEAARKAQEFLFDYSDIPPWVKHTKRWGIPFLTFSYKAWPLMMKMIVKKPVKMAALLSSTYIMHEIAQKHLGMSDVEAEKERSLMPPWQRKRSFGIGPYLQVLMPWKDRWGNHMYWDAANLFPYGSLGDEVGQSGFPGAEFVPVGNPFASLLYGLALNRNSFTGKDIFNKKLYEAEREIEELATRALAEKLQKQFEFVWQGLGPPIAPGGYNYSKLKTGLLNTLNKEAQVLDWADRPYELSDSIMSAILGVKLSPANTEKMKEFELYKIREISAELAKQKRTFKRLLDNNEISQKEYDKAIEHFKKRQMLILKHRSEKLK